MHDKSRKNAGLAAMLETGNGAESGGEAADYKFKLSKPAFVKPHLICYGAVVDLTNQFGGSLTPEEREAQGIE